MELTAEYAGYDSRGAIIANYRLQPSIVAMLRGQGESFIDGQHDEATRYVKDGAVTDRPVNPARLDGTTLRDLPAPCAIVIDGARYDCADDHADLDLPYAKTYAVTVEVFPYLDAHFSVTKP